ncbi:hypothetical protein J6590_069125 [Homalodisca vitripennis]|nr:hypothetical protein J6590_069125 [Homalodisca vitripennis]
MADEENPPEGDQPPEDAGEPAQEGGEPAKDEEVPPSATGEAPPAPIGPMQDLDKIITETQDIVLQHQTHINEQKKTLTTMMFILSRISSSLISYKEHYDQMFAFLYHNDVKQTEWFRRYFKELPVYGDYMDVFPEAPEAMQFEDVPHPLAKSTVETLCQDVVNNMYGGGMIVKTQRTLGKDIHKRMDLKRKTMEEQMAAMEPWLLLFTTELKNEDRMNDKVFEIASLVEFLKTDNFKQSEPLKLDLRKMAFEDW